MGQPRISDTDYYVLIWGCACSSPPTTQTHQPTRHALHPRNDARHTPPRPYCPRFCIPAGCWQGQATQNSQLAGSSHSWRARRPDTTRQPSQRSVRRLKTPTTQPTRHASAQGPYRLCGDPQLAVDPSLDRPAPDLGHRSAAEIWHPAETGEERLRAPIRARCRGPRWKRLYLRHGHGQRRLVQSEKRYLGAGGCAPAQLPESARIRPVRRAAKTAKCKPSAPESPPMEPRTTGSSSLITRTTTMRSRPSAACGYMPI